MSDVVNAELLKLCDEVLFTEPKGDETLGEIKDICTLARALKSRLQAEAPTDAEVAEIARRDAEPIPLSLTHAEFTRRASQAEIDRHTLLAKLRATSQAEAQAPTTVASVLTEAVYAWVNEDLSIGAKMTIGFFIQRLIDRLNSTAGAPAPAPPINESIYWSKEDTYDAPPTTTETNSNE